ncbi:MAG: hypothetical protein ACE5KG_02360 [Nitrososphaerales archaeon]
MSDKASLRYAVKGVADMGTHVQLTIREDIETEQIDLSERVLDSVVKNQEMPDEVKKVMTPYLESVFKSMAPLLPNRQPTVTGGITLSLPKRLYEQINRPGIGDSLIMDLRKG